MANVVNFSTDELDFDSIAASLRNYLSYQTEFKDYNFQGSALSTLVNLLAYNTHYNALFLFHLRANKTNKMLNKTQTAAAKI